MVRSPDIPGGVRRWIPPLAAVVAAGAVFAPALGFGFLEYDDPIYVFQNPLSHDLSLTSLVEAFFAPYFRSYAPLTLLTHAIDLRLWGARAGMHHFGNLLLHAANVVMVFFAALRVAGEVSGRPAGAGSKTEGGDPAGAAQVAGAVATFSALSTALLFSIHPLQVEPVAWISGRKDVLVAAFLLGSFLAYPRRPVLAAVLFTFAALSKSTAAAFPLVLVVYDRLVLGRREGLRVLIREKAFMLAVSGAVVVAAVMAGRGFDTSDLVAGIPPAERVLLLIFTPVYYLWLLVWPSGLTPYTPPPATVLVVLGAGVTVVLTSLLVRLRFRALLGGWLAYLILLAPTVGGTLLETGMQPWADRFAYVPLIPVFLALGAGVSRISPRLARVGALSVAVVLLALASRDQLRHWEDTESIWTRVVDASPTLAKGYKNLGSIRNAQGRHEEAIALFRKAVALKPSYAEAHNDLGLALTATGRFGEAVESHRLAIALDSTRAEGYNRCGIALLRMGDVRGAREVLDRGVAAHPGSARLRFNAGTAALTAGDTAGAIARFQETAVIDSTVAAAPENAAVLMELTGVPDARQWYERAAAAGSVPAREWLARRAAGHREDGR